VQGLLGVYEVLPSKWIFDRSSTEEVSKINPLN